MHIYGLFTRAYDQISLESAREVQRAVRNHEYKGLLVHRRGSIYLVTDKALGDDMKTFLINNTDAILLPPADNRYYLAINER